MLGSIVAEKDRELCQSDLEQDPCSAHAALAEL